MKADRMILGENAIFSMDSSKTGVNNNVLVVGSTGCGKTMSISEPQLLETNNNSLIVTLTKRTLADNHKKVIQYDVISLPYASSSESPWNPVFPRAFITCRMVTHIIDEMNDIYLMHCWNDKKKREK